jgi:toxin ParE1/3/4
LKTEPASADVLAIVDYISDDSPDAAQRLKDDIKGEGRQAARVPEAVPDGPG